MPTSNSTAAGSAGRAEPVGQSGRGPFPAAEGSGAALGLRERRRLQTRTDIGEAALALFEERGVEATTVENIAAAAGVSPRTFFRYFANKEEAALPAQLAFDAAVEEGLRAAEGPGSPRLKLEVVYSDILARYADPTSEESQRMLAARRLIRREPVLQAAQLRLGVMHQAAVVDILAARFKGVDRLQLRLAVELSAAVVRVAFDTWAGRLQDGTKSSLVELYDDARKIAHEDL